MLSFKRNYLFGILLQFILNYYTIEAYFFQKCETEPSASASKVADTINGKVKGECYNVPVSYSNGSTMNYGVFSWLSIPYAEPPINQNRFMKPLPVQSWNNTRDALVWPKLCIQSGYSNAPNLFSEDCLYLNIFVRSDAYLNKATSKQPILIYIHGGAFVSGTSSSDMIEPSTLVAMSNVIVVTINYRLNAFGFIHLSDSEITGNQGLLDQTMALKWVYENAERFGGDKTRITISGESAGAWSVGLHLYYSKSWPYFRNAIMQSGGPTGPNNFYLLINSSEASKNTLSLMDIAGCNQTSNADKVKCLQNVDPSNILIMGDLFDRPIHDQVVFNKTIDALARENSFKSCNIITGYTSDEFGYFLSSLFSVENLNSLDAATFKTVLSIFIKSRSVYEKLNVDDIFNKYIQNQTTIINPQYLIDITSDLVFVGQSFQMAELYSKRGKNAYVYEYKYRIATSPFDPIFGVAVHTEELPIVFAEPLSNKISPLLNEESNYNPYNAYDFNYSSNAKRFSEGVVKYWTNFIKFDDPSYNIIESDEAYWKTFVSPSTNLNIMTAEAKMNAGRYLLIQENNTKMEMGFASHKVQFWNFTSGSFNLASSKYEVNSIYMIIQLFLIILATL